MKCKYIIVLLFGLSILAVYPAAPVQAATITVTSKLDTPDPGKCRLRDAITAANSDTATGDCPAGGPGMDTIGFNLGVQCSVTPCTIVLTSPLPTIEETLTINGGNTIISGANAFRVFNLGPVVAYISNLSIVNGHASGSIADGGAILTLDTHLYLTNVSFSNNHAHSGGAVYQGDGALYLLLCSFSGNGADSGGGAIAQDYGFISMSHSSFNNNSADNGGALSLFEDAYIVYSTFSGNYASSGGAIRNGSSADIELWGSVFYNNVATGLTSVSGGGALFTEGRATLTNVTISGNSSKYDGGGISAKIVSPFPDTILLNNVTITNNTADNDNDGSGNGGGISQLSIIVEVQNSIIAGNFDTPGNAGGGAINSDCAGTFVSQGYNLIGKNSGCSGFVNGLNGDQVGSGASPVNPLLGPLQNNGGLTQTHALLPGSPAIDAANPSVPGSGTACDLFDQRDINRPQGSTCDIGAFEAVTELLGLNLYLPLVIR